MITHPNKSHLRTWHKMVILSSAIKIASTVFKYRKYIYRTLVAQDRAIDKAFKVGGYSRQVRYGARHGALAGSIIGTIISDTSPDSPGNGIQKPFRKQSPTRKPYQTRSRQSIRYGARCRPDYKSYSSSRRPRTRFTSRNRYR